MKFQEHLSARGLLRVGQPADLERPHDGARRFGRAVPPLTSFRRTITTSASFRSTRTMWDLTSAISIHPPAWH